MTVFAKAMDFHADLGSEDNPDEETIRQWLLTDVPPEDRARIAESLGVDL